jgi:HAD superfamily hydrolase (TIGR01509 family)
MKAAVIFDLDGTLTKPILDFDAIRAEIGGIKGPILEALSSLTIEHRTKAEEVLERHEREAAQRAELYEGAIEVVAECRRRGHPVAILTRNARINLVHVLERFGMIVDASRTREDGAIKPSAEPVLSLCKELAADPEKSWMVGDYRFDILSGRAAGTRTVLMIGAGPPPDYAHEADHVIASLHELLEIVR